MISQDHHRDDCHDHPHHYFDDQEEEERPSSVVPGNALVVDPKLPYRPKTQKKNYINVFPIYLGPLQNCFRRSCLGLNCFPHQVPCKVSSVINPPVKTFQVWKLFSQPVPADQAKEPAAQ